MKGLERSGKLGNGCQRRGGGERERGKSHQQREIEETEQSGRETEQRSYRGVKPTSCPSQRLGAWCLVPGHWLHGWPLPVGALASVPGQEMSKGRDVEFVHFLFLLYHLLKFFKILFSFFSSALTTCQAHSS